MSSVFRLKKLTTTKIKLSGKYVLQLLVCVVENTRHKAYKLALSGSRSFIILYYDVAYVGEVVLADAKFFNIIINKKKT